MKIALEQGNRELVDRLHEEGAREDHCTRDLLKKHKQVWEPMPPALQYVGDKGGGNLISLGLLPEPTAI